MVNAAGKPATITEGKNKATDWDYVTDLLGAAKSHYNTSWRAHHKDLTDHIKPSLGRYLVTDKDDGKKRMGKILNEYATDSFRVLREGFQNGKTPSTRPWFNYQTEDPDLMAFKPVKVWLSDVESIVRGLLLKTNFYGQTPKMYENISILGTAAMSQLRDPVSLMEFQNYPIGSYYIAGGQKNTVQEFHREMEMTAREILGTFGKRDEQGRITTENLTQGIARAISDGNMLERFKVNHSIFINSARNSKSLDIKVSGQYRQVYYVPDNTEKNFLLEDGYNKFPVRVPRWDKELGDVYGTWCPGITSLPSIRMLQTMEIKSLKAFDKGVDPTLNVDSALQQNRISNLPADKNFVDFQQGRSPGIVPMYVPDPNFLLMMENKISQIEKRISRSSFEDLFLLLSNSTDQERTAFEVARLEEEKLQMLGGVVGSINNEILDDVVEGMYHEANRRGLIPPIPDELRGQNVKVVYSSILDTALASVGLVGIERYINFAGGISKLTGNSRAFDKIDVLQTMDEVGTALNVPPRIVRSDEEVERQDQIKAERASQQQELNNAEQASQVTKNLSQSQTADPSALTAIAEAG